MGTRETVITNLIRALHFIASACLSAGLVYLINASLGGPDGYDFLTPWALMHGSFLLVIPVFILITWLLYALLRPASLRLRSRYSSDRELQSRRISVLAVFSLIFAFLGFVVPLIFSLVAVILGHMARKRCRDQTNMGGSAIVLSGLIVGYLSFAFGIYVVGTMIIVMNKETLPLS